MNFIQCFLIFTLMVVYSVTSFIIDFLLNEPSKPTDPETVPEEEEESVEGALDEELDKLCSLGLNLMLIPPSTLLLISVKSSLNRLCVFS